MQAQNTATHTRAHWEQAKKPFVISFEDDKNFNEPLSLGVYAQLNDATQEECTALSGVVFIKKGREYGCADRNASTTDSTALVYACFPYHKGLKVQDTLQMKAPFEDQLFATESERNFTNATNVKMKMQSSMAKLRIKWKVMMYVIYLTVCKYLETKSIPKECINLIKDYGFQKL